VIARAWLATAWLAAGVPWWQAWLASLPPWMDFHSLWFVCVVLFVDGATIAAASTWLILSVARWHAVVPLALAGAVASAAGSGVQLALLRWALHSGQPWMRRFAPSRGRIDAALRDYPSASFVALLVARATPLPDAPLKLVAAVAGYPVRLYVLATFLGSLPYFAVLALVGHRFRVPWWVLAAALALVVLGVGVDALRRRWRPRVKPTTDS